MTKSLLSCFAIFLTSITSSANAQDTPANIDTADNVTTILSQSAETYVIDKTSGFCYLTYYDSSATQHGVIIPVETPIEELESFASSDLVKQSIAAVSEQLNALSGYAAKIAFESEYFRQELESITRRITRYLSVFKVIKDEAIDAYNLLESYKNPTTDKACEQKRISNTSTRSGVSYEFDLSTATKKCFESIDRYIWIQENIQRELENAVEQSEKIISAAATEIGRIDSILNLKCIAWKGRIDEINEQITPDMDVSTIESAKIDLQQIIEEVRKEADDLYAFMESAMYYNPWGNLERLIDDCTQSLGKYNPESEAQKAREVAENLRQLDLPSRITENAAREEWTIRIPSTFEYDEEYYGQYRRNQFTITRIIGNILVSNETRAPSANLTVIIPESITLLANGALASTSVTQVIVENATPPALDNENPPFTGMMESSKILVVPDGAVNSYRDSDWSRYFAIILPMSAASVEGLVNENPNATEVFSIQGVKVGDSTDNLPKGIYILRQGNSNRKIIIN